METTDIQKKTWPAEDFLRAKFLSKEPEQISSIAFSPDASPNIYISFDWNDNIDADKPYLSETIYLSVEKEIDDILMGPDFYTFLPEEAKEISKLREVALENMNLPNRPVLETQIERFRNKVIDIIIRVVWQNRLDSLIRNSKSLQNYVKQARIIMSNEQLC